MRRKNKGQYWILGSASPRRREILKQLGLTFRVEPSRMFEPARRAGETPSDYAVRLACLKASDVAGRHASGLVIGVDTVVVIGNSIFGKPRTKSEARSMLKGLSGRWHEVISGICIFDCRLGRPRTDFSRSRVHFRRLSTKDIDWYLKTGEHRDKAGAYGVQGYASLFIDRIEGCYFNIVGFPIQAFRNLCRRAGIDLTDELNLGPANT
jgi:septum formation protein